MAARTANTVIAKIFFIIFLFCIKCPFGAAIIINLRTFSKSDPDDWNLSKIGIFADEISGALTGNDAGGSEKHYLRIMSEEKDILEEITSQEYEHGFVTDVEQEFLPKGLNEDIIRMISAKKEEPQWLLDFRLDAFRKWQKMPMPQWAHLTIPEIDFQDIIYFAAPKKEHKDKIDPELEATFEKLGIPLHEREALAGVAVDAVFDSVSVKTTFRKTLAEKGIIFCPFSEAVREYPDLVRKYLASVVPVGDNFYAALNSAVFSDGSFCYIPKGVRCPMELSSYFRINASGTGQFERTLIVADEGSYVSYLEGCTAPMRDENQLHAAVVEIVVEKDADVKYSTVQNWYPGEHRWKRARPLHGNIRALS